MYELHEQIISFVFLAAAIAIGCLLKKNMGAVSIGLALILGRIFGVSDSAIIKSFNSSLFIMLLGVMFLFSIAQNNRTLELLARRAVVLCRGKVQLIPIVLFVFSAIVSALGPGLISTTALVAPLAIALAVETDVDPIRFVLFGALGAFAGGLSPITPSGIVAITVAADNGIEGVDLAIALSMFLVMLLCAVGLYFLVFKWHKYKSTAPVHSSEGGDSADGFKRENIFTVIGLLLVAVGAMVFEMNVGLISFAVSVVLLILGAADEADAFKKIPWSTLVMITGVGMLISVVTELGGIKLLSDIMEKIMNEYVASAVATIFSGVTSWVSSASGVVMPTYIPMVANWLESIPNLNAVDVVTGICIGANVAAFSPLSSCGAIMLAAYSNSKVVTPEGRQKMFNRLFVFSAACIGVSAIIALTGFFKIF